MNAFFDGQGYLPGDIALAVLVTASALVTYARVGFEGGTLRMPVPRMFIAMGFTLLALRFWVTLYMGGDVTVPPLSMVAMAMICGGYCTVQLRAIRRAMQIASISINCFRDPEWACQREDRVQEAILTEWRGKQ